MLIELSMIWRCELNGFIHVTYETQIFSRVLCISKPRKSTLGGSGALLINIIKVFDKLSSIDDVAFTVCVCMYTYTYTHTLT
jgi:hypothetical protein